MLGGDGGNCQSPLVLRRSLHMLLEEAGAHVASEATSNPGGMVCILPSHKVAVHREGSPPRVGWVVLCFAHPWGGGVRGACCSRHC